MTAEPLVKCVVWDLDDTVWDGVAVERADDSLPEPKPEVLRVIDVLAQRGVLSSVASRTAPYLADLLRADQRFTERFVAVQASWDDKSTALRRIADELGLALDSLVLVDDSAYERAQVSAALPEVRVLAPESVAEWLDSPAFAAGGGTTEARSRVAKYRQQERRENAARAFSGTREEFYRECDMRLRITPAEPGDLDRVIELASRTHRLNSTSEVPEREWLAGALDSDEWIVPVARLSDVFGDYGLIGAALVRRGPREAPDAWWVRLLALSCRIAGRGVGSAFLRWVMDRAVDAGASRLAVDSRATKANTELRVLFRQCGLRAPEDSGDAERTTFWRSLDAALPATPSWLQPAGQPVERAVRSLLAEATGRPREEIDAFPADVGLFAPEIALTSVEGVHLLTSIKQRFGVDVAAEDLNLDALESIASLSSFVSDRSGISSSR